jgi:hypothetical protein
MTLTKFKVGGLIYTDDIVELKSIEVEAQNGWHAMKLFEKSLAPNQRIKAISAGKIRKEAA